MIMHMSLYAQDKIQLLYFKNYKLYSKKKNFSSIFQYKFIPPVELKVEFLLL